MKTLLLAAVAIALAFWLGYEYARYEMKFYNQRTINGVRI